MSMDDRRWAPVVAEREAPASACTPSFPCRGQFNRYTGCIGARRCRGLGVAMCILGRWPDDRQGEISLARADAAPAPAMTGGERPPREPAPRPLAASANRQKLSVGIVHADRQLAQAFARNVQAAGYRPLSMASLADLAMALDQAAPPHALIVDGALVHQDPAGERLLARAGDADVPVLSLPTGLRRQGNSEAATRMAIVWLTVTLRGPQAARRAG